ncbi:MAG: hypothetical protein AAGA54_31755 [Myxococcota bacterium]
MTLPIARLNTMLMLLGVVACGPVDAESDAADDGASTVATTGTPTASTGSRGAETTSGDASTGAPTTSSAGATSGSSGSELEETGGETSTGAVVPACDVDAATLPILPCAEGYGIETPAGSGRHLDPPQTEIMVVDSLADEGPGTLRACVEASGPRTCVFAIAGVIELTDFITASSPYLTVAGQTAPSPGISLHGAGIRVMTDDVLLQHLRIRVGDRPEGPPVHNRDAIWISNPDDPPERIIIDHCSLALSSDEMLSVWYEAGDVSVLDTVMGWALNDSIHVDEGASGPAPHGFGPLLGQWGARVYFARNALVHQEGRNPLSRTAQLVFANNVVHNFGPGASRVTGDDPTQNAFLENVYQRGADTPTGRPPLRVDPASGSAVYIEGMMLDGVVFEDAWSEIDLATNDDVIAAAVPTALAPATMPAEDVVSFIDAYGGAWPQERDAIDVELLADVREGTGTIINCVEDDGSERCSLNAGGWPDADVTMHTLDLPADPMGDDNADGYTNLEAWLHARAAEVEGR